MLKVGDKAPEFALMSNSGQTVSLKDFRGETVVLYFYPKDDTPGCTTESCSFRDNFDELEKLHVVILGISADGLKSHQKFSEKYRLPFPLLSDEDKKVIKEYGVWQKKNFMGKSYMGIIRTTFIINPAGKIAHIYPKVKVDGHVEDIIQRISA